MRSWMERNGWRNGSATYNGEIAKELTASFKAEGEREEFSRIDGENYKRWIYSFALVCVYRCWL